MQLYLKFLQCDVRTPETFQVFVWFLSCLIVVLEYTFVGNEQEYGLSP